MTVERGLRLMAGTFILLSLALGHWLSFCWAESFSVRDHQLVSSHVPAKEGGIPRFLSDCFESVERGFLRFDNAKRIGLWS
jgi:hypothetical protein